MYLPRCAPSVVVLVVALDAEGINVNEEAVGRINASARKSMLILLAAVVPERRGRIMKDKEFSERARVFSRR